VIIDLSLIVWSVDILQLLVRFMITAQGSVVYLFEIYFPELKLGWMMVHSLVSHPGFAWPSRFHFPKYPSIGSDFPKVNLSKSVLVNDVRTTPHLCNNLSYSMKICKGLNVFIHFAMVAGRSTCCWWKQDLLEMEFRLATIEYK